MKRVSLFLICYILMKPEDQHIFCLGSTSIFFFFNLYFCKDIRTNRGQHSYYNVHNNHAQWKPLINALSTSYLTFMVGCGI